MIIEDEIKVHEVMEAYLKKDGFQVHFATTGEEGLAKFDAHSPDLVVLDLMLPGISGEEVCRRIRSHSDIPILMLTAKSSEEDRIDGFTIGADDYLVKPFSPRELVMRIKSILKRTYGINKKSEMLSFNQGDLAINLMEHYVLKKGEEQKLTPVEYKVLELFAKNPHVVFSRETLIESVFGIDFNGYDRTVDAHIKNIRKKIEVDPKKPKYICTVFGFGYKFEGEKDEA